jgi:glycolate oxidase iron-sulfur subunit
MRADVSTLSFNFKEAPLTSLAHESEITMTDETSMQAKRLIDKDLLDACIHCGLCLPACPTYLATGRETESPRGRIYLLNAWQTGEQPLTARLIEHIDSCLGCLGCQTACPSGVNYEEILNQARPEIAKKSPLLARQIRRYIFERVLPNYASLRRFAAMLRLWQKMKGRAILSKIASWIKLPYLSKLAALEAYLPEIPTYKELPRQSWNVGKKEGTVQLFGGCLMDVFYGPVNHACCRLLRAQGQVVEVPEQTCCGALAYHAGEQDIAFELAARNINFFENRQGPIVVAAAGCSAMLKHYGKMFADKSELSERARQFSERIEDVSEFLYEHSFGETLAGRAQAYVPSVAYHAACHLSHAQDVRVQPQALLTRLVDDIAAKKGKSMTLIPLVDAEMCCGSAGIFNILHQELSDQVLSAKMTRIKETGAALVVTSNPGCLLQLEYGARRFGVDVEVRHLAELLDHAYGLKDEES